MASKTTHLRFVERMRQYGHKTLVWDVQSLDGAPLGAVKWYSHWRKYTFSTLASGDVFDEGCLREIADFVEAQTSTYKQGQL